jgi:integrase/recombinase XerD
MNPKKPTDLSVCLTSYLGQHLPAQRNLSANTLKAYRDVFVLLLRYARDERKIPPDRLCIKDVDVEMVGSFLEYLEISRGCSTQTRNHRLAALRAFFRWLQSEEPRHLHQCQQILGIRMRRHESEEVQYLSNHELEVLLAQPNMSTRKGRRDAVMLSVLYDAAVRCQELIDLSVQDIRLDKPARIHVMGKGRKNRAVPLMDSTAKLIHTHLLEIFPDIAKHAEQPLFRSRNEDRFSRSGVRYIVNKYARLARRVCVGFPSRIGPHTFRHTKAMSLLHAGVPLIVIRDILGHEDIKSTEIYARADLEMKRQALEKTADAASSFENASWKSDKTLLDWLVSR